MDNYYQFIIPRLNGKDIGNRFKYYLSLVKKGVAGFIVFGGRLEEIREGIGRLQAGAELPLIIASDLEQGLGQQIAGGTVFPPAMAVASATGNSPDTGISVSRLKLLRKVFKVMALEAQYAGINTILAPVLDINTNPLNPIISVRSFGGDSSTVSFFGTEMVRALQRRRIAACGKHFPGHGDTDIDSHIKLPSVNRDINGLQRNELIPFRKAIEAGVKLIMLGHLKAPALDSSGIPVSLSENAVAFLKEKMKFRGIIVTDALNMGALGRYSEQEASMMALKAGVDIILHPTNPARVVSYLSRKNIVLNPNRLIKFRKGINRSISSLCPDFDNSRHLSVKLSRKAIKLTSGFRINKKPFLVVLNDEKEDKGRLFVKILRKKFPGLKTQTVRPGSGIRTINIPAGTFVIIAIFSDIRPWKGGAGKWLSRCLLSLAGRADLLISFGSPYILNDIKDASKMFVYWDSDEAQKEAADVILSRA